MNKINIFVLIIMLLSIQTISTMRYNFYEIPEQSPQEKLNETLLAAAGDGDIKEATEAIARGADVNYKYIYTPLLTAIRSNKFDMVKLLINNGADPNKRGPMGITPLINAAIIDNLLMVKFLLENGANPVLAGYTHGINFVDKNAIQMAEVYGYDDVANYIKEYQAKRQKEIEKGTPLPSVLVGLVEEYEGYKEPSKEVHECE